MKNRAKKGLAGIFVLFIAFFSVMHLSLVWDILVKINAKDTLSTVVKKIHDVYPKKLDYKYDFLDLNGFFARLIGKCVLNDIYVLQNGILTRKLTPPQPVIGTAIRDMSLFCRQNGMEFFYVQAPYKVNLKGEGLPPGYANEVNQAISVMLESLQKENVFVKDLRPLLASTPEDVEEYFYRTDHHWNTDGAFLAYQEIVKILAERFPEKIPTSYVSYLDINSWTRTVYKDWLLGSEGKRVGRYFGGVDDVILYLPKFSSQMSMAIHKHRQLHKGNFESAHIRRKYIDNSPDYYRTNAYVVYGGGDYPFVHMRNMSAPSSLKVMLIKDSFSLPFSAFLSTIFQEIDLVDARHIKGKGLTPAEYALYTKPDVVIQMNNPSTMFIHTHSVYGLDASPHKPSFQQEFFKDRITLRPRSGNNFNNVSLNQIMGNDKLKNNTVYRFRASRVSVDKGLTEGVSLALYDLYDKKRHVDEVFDIEYCSRKQEFEWVFKTPSTGRWSLLLYSGIAERTSDVGVTYHNVTLERDVSRDN